MRQITTIILLTLFFVLATSCSKTEENFYSTLFGIVSDNETGNPINAATVVLSPSGKTTVSGADGRYEFKDLEVMQYTVTVQKTGYLTNRKTVTVVSGESVQADIPMTKEE